MAKITFPVEASHIMMFARSIGDTNPVYHDAEAAKKTEAGGIIEVQGTAEGAPFSRAEMQTMLDLAQSGISQLIAAQRVALG